jgi:hypothetical protein
VRISPRVERAAIDEAIRLKLLRAAAWSEADLVASSHCDVLTLEPAPLVTRKRVFDSRASRSAFSKRLMPHGAQPTSFIVHVVGANRLR